MKTINYKKIILPIIAIAAFMFYLNSCKKANIDVPATQNVADARAIAIKAIKEKYGNVSAGYTVNVDKTADEVFYRNTAGKMVSLYGSGNQLVAAPCIYTCNNTTNPANLRIVYTLDYVQRFYICESSGDKSKLSVKWTVSVPFGITDVTPDGVLNTFGKVQFTPTSGPAVILTATANDPGFTYTSLGTDPACGVNTLYSVTYYFDNVDNSNFASGTQLDALLSLSNDCALIGYLSATSYVNAPSFNQSAYLPCNRIEKVYVNPALPPTSPTTTATGNYIMCSPPSSGLTLIDNHQLEYRKVTATSGSLKWDDQPSSTSTVYWGVPVFTSTASPTINPYGVSTLVNMTASSGTWLVRYRNVKTSVCDIFSPLPSGAPGANWGNSALWITEVWTL